MWRRFLDGACRLTTSIEFQRSSMADSSGADDSGSIVSGRRRSKGTAFFGTDQKKLDLMLNLHEADFGSMVKATKAALEKEKRRKEAAFGEVVVMKDTLPERKESLEVTSALSSFVSYATARVDGDNTSANVTQNDTGMENREVRGIVGAGTAHDTNSLIVVRQQRKMEGARYALMDALRDCFLSGDWVKAMCFFETAIKTSCKASQGTLSRVVAVSSSSSSSSSASTSESEEREFLDALRRINATIPPGSFSMNLPRHNGILRWGGGHFYLLLKLLLSRHRVTEAERVWDVMKRIGFVEFHMDTRTLNQCIALAQRSDLPDILFPVLDVKKAIDDRGKSFRRTFVLELGEWAKKKGVQLNQRSTRTTHAVRLANAVKDGDGGDGGCATGELDAEGLKVGDFSGLLRRCTSEESTLRVLQMMEKLNVSRDGRIYSALIGALRQPHYRVGNQLCSSDENVTKEEYDAHRKKRWERARQWFRECPEGARTVDVYNEILHITRGGEEEEVEYERLLSEFRGAPLTFSAVSLDSVNRVASAENIEQLGTASSSSSPPSLPSPSKHQGVQEVRLLPPHWRLPPNGRTYEIMMSRCRHRKEWQILWALFEEMMERRVKGTHRLYQILLEVAGRYPPQGRDSHSVVMELYQDMRQCGFDVSGIKGTVGVVNAWCATRSRQRRYHIHMSSPESLNFDVESAAHYIHCILSNIPMSVALSEVASMIVPAPESDIVGRLKYIGCRIVPHQLHVFKEPLDTKFGFITFFVYKALSETRPEVVHELLLDWVENDLKRQLASIQITLTLGQPSDCYSSVPFLHAMHEQCSFLDPNVVKDTRKLETFLLSKILFPNRTSNTENEAADSLGKNAVQGMGDCGARRAKASFRISSLSAQELLWLSRENRCFPPILVTNGNFEAATCDQKVLHDFLRSSLHPLFEVEQIATAIELPDAVLQNLASLTYTVVGPAADAFAHHAKSLLPSLDALVRQFELRLQHPFAGKLPLLNFWHVVFAIFCYFSLTVLLLFVGKVLGKSKYKLLVLAHNLFLCILSLYMSVSIFFSARAANYSLWNNASGTSHAEWRLAKVIWLFYVSKIPEWMDTFIMCLKQNRHQISFLHLYHHSSVFLIWYMCCNVAPGGEAYWSSFMNSSVHVVMYGYYFLTVLFEDGMMRRFLNKFKFIITKGQMVQFFLNCVQSVYDLYIIPRNSLKYDVWLLQLMFFYMITLLVLFGNFLIKAPKRVIATRRKPVSDSTHSSQTASSKRSTSGKGNALKMASELHERPVFEDDKKKECIDISHGKKRK